MATASSAQREPSMEEILASIRRIIEDSDSGRKQPDDADDLRQDLKPAASEAPAADVDAFRAELRPSLEVRKPVTLAEVQAQTSAAEPRVARMDAPERTDPVAPRASMTLAEVSARIAAEPLPAERADRPAAPEAGAASDAIVADWRREIAAVGEQAKAIPGIRKPVAQPEAPVDEPIPEPAFERAPSIAAPATTDEARKAADETPAARPAILSEHTGRQVAAAFGELSDAFASRSKKTFDEMAEEMLRPMLQDWLDNNLPTLVERLVREEIERVARGAQ
ncbi:PopZ family protein [Mesorhizobium sp. BR1-1-13]|uniref:PopZ family protein n=1 Tax=Mesorhizobium sp. BR1-1-13 TaxID=2876656 RepID=UPI001CD0AFB3|nr:PopZ family protein [Mesorhizobium sp. BR1-1-13]MBZ9941758.1 PopZ family protein [Mesorhizobium sp. BR1-1-13]